MSHCAIQVQVREPWGLSWKDRTEPHVGGSLPDHVRAADDPDAWACPSCTRDPGTQFLGGRPYVCETCHGTGCVDLPTARDWRD